jgi:hypothetical protein
MTRKFILTESEKNEIKSLYRTKGILKEITNPKGKCISGDCNNGKGVKEFDNGDKYEGDFKNGELNGKGTYTWKPGEFAKSGERNKYVGEFKNNKISGKGTHYKADGSKTESNNFGEAFMGSYNLEPFPGKGKVIETDSKGIKYVIEYDDRGFPNWDLYSDGLRRYFDGDISSQKEADEYMKKITNGNYIPPGSSSSTTKTQTKTKSNIDTTDCWSLFDEAKKEVTYNPCNLKDGKVVIGKGNQGALVKAMQCFLNRTNEELSLGLPSLKVDGKFGDKTKEMVIKFQQKYPNELKDDGIIGKNTYLAGLIPGETGNC